MKKLRLFFFILTLCELTAVSTLISTSRADNQDWSPPQTIVQDDLLSSLSSSSIAVDSNGNWHVVYCTYLVTDDNFHRGCYIKYVSSVSGPCIIADFSDGVEAVANASIAVDPNGGLHVIYLHYTHYNDRHCSIKYTKNTSGSWSPPQTIALSPQPEYPDDWCWGSGLSIAVDSDFNWHVVYDSSFRNSSKTWKYYINYINSASESYIIAESTYNFETYEGTTVWDPVIAADPNGGLHVAYRQESRYTGAIKYTNNLSGYWSTPQTIAGAPRYGFSFTVDSNNNWHLVFGDSNYASGITFSLIRYISSTQSSDIIVETITYTNSCQLESVGYPSIAVDPKGKLHVIYRYTYGNHCEAYSVHHSIKYTARLMPWLIPGDLLLGLGTKIVPGFWSHIGMYIGNGQVVEAHESLGGVAISSLESWFVRYKTWAALRVITANSEIREKAINWATHPDRLDDPYDLMWWQKDLNGEAWYCSELVWAAYFHASNGQINLEHGPDFTGITPDEVLLDEDTKVIAEHYEATPQEGFTVIAKSPVDLKVADPDNLSISKSLFEIPGAIYGEEVDEDGSIEDWIGIPERKNGKYLISVIPEPGASPTDTYTLKVLLGDNTILTLADNVQIRDIPSQPYIVQTSEITIIAVAGANGNIIPSGAVQVTHGSDQTFTIIPDPGYHVADVLVDGVSVGAVTTYTFSNITSDHTIHVTFTIDIPVTAGWNLISIPVQPLDNTLGKVLESIDGCYQSVWSYSGGWKKYIAGAPEGFNDLETIEPGNGYWINALDNCTLMPTGSPITETAVLLEAGWNLVGYKGQIVKPLDEAISSIYDEYISAWGYNGVWKRHIKGATGNNLEMMEPGKGYWINVTEDCVWDIDVTSLAPHKDVAVRNPYGIRPDIPPIPFIMYGEVWVDGVKVKAGSEPVPEVVLKEDGKVLYKYRLGSVQRYKDFYMLEVPVSKKVELYVQFGDADMVPAPPVAVMPSGMPGQLIRFDLSVRRAPEVSQLHQNYPNPFNPDTWIPYQLKEDSTVKIKIYTSTGQLVRTLDLGYKPAGFYTTKDRAAYWDGRNESGELVASGIYFYTIQAGDFTAVKKMVIQK